MFENDSCRNGILAAALMVGASAAIAQASPAVGTQTPVASIEVATIKPHPSDVMHNNWAFHADRMVLEDQPLFKLIAFAYAINQRQIVNAPAWTEDAHWDIDARTNLTTDATIAQQQQLMRQLFVERFGLRFHYEKRTMPVYAVQIARGGPKLTPSATPNAQPLEQGLNGGAQKYTNNSIKDFMVYMQLFQDRPMVDQTGLTGRYDFTLTYSRGNGPDTDPDAPPPLFTAVQEQLGLKFQAVTAPVDVMVIDHIEKPSAN